jgi:hypothetical protein
MRIRLTRLDDRRHVLEIERADGSRERAELETRSTLRHDLTHLALEEAAGLDDGFFGALAAGRTLAELSGDAIYSGRRLAIERAVAVLQGMTREATDPRAVYTRVVESLAIQGETPPEWFTAELVVAVHARLRALLGRWGATPYGGVMELTWLERGRAGGPGSERASCG